MRILLFLFTFLLSDIAFSQEVAIELANSKSVYLTYENPMSIVAKRIDCKDLLIEIDNGKINKNSNCTFNIIPKTIGVINVKIYKNSKGEKQLLKTDRLYATHFPRIEAYVSRKRENKLVSKLDLKINRGLNVPIQVSNMSGTYGINKFKYKFIRNGKTFSEGVSTKDEFSKEFYTKVDYLKNFDEVLFYDIEVNLSGYITPVLIDPIKVIVYDSLDIEFISTEFYPYSGIYQYYWKDSLAKNQIQHWENDKIKTKYIDISKNIKKRFDYDDAGNELRECIVKQKIESDTITLYDPETYEEITTINTGYIDILNGRITEYFPYKSEKIISRQGQYKDNLKIGIWKACKETAPDNYECYEAEFKDDVMVGEIKKL